MGDPTARFVLSGEDRSVAAFDSLDHNLHGIGRSISQTTRFFHEFGLALGLNEVRKWIAGALDVQKASFEQGIAINESKRALEELNSEFEDVARTISIKLIPQVTQAAKFWREMLFPTEQESAVHQLDGILQQQQASIKQMQDQVKGGGAPGSFWKWGLLGYFFGGESIDETKAKIVDAQRVATDTFGKLIAARDELANKPPPVEDWLKSAMLGPSAAPGPKIEILPDLDQAVWDAKVAELKPIEVQIEPHMLPFPDGQLEPVKNKLRDFAEESLGRGLHDSIVNGLVTGEFAFKDFLKRMAAELFTSALFQGFASMFTGGGAGSSFFAGLFGGKRAAGGPVSAGRSYLVGERGPEILTMGASGSISPNGGGGLVYAPVYNIDNRGAGAGSEAGLRAMLAQRDRQQKAEIADLMRRGRFSK